MLEYMTSQRAIELYTIEKEKEEREEKENEPTLREKRDKIAEAGVPRQKVNSMTIDEIEKFYIKMMEVKAEQEDDKDQIMINEIRGEIISMLVDDKIISEDKLMNMPDEDLVKFCEEVYGKGILEEIITAP